MSADDVVKKFLPLPILARIAYMRQYWLVGEWELRELHRLAAAPGLAVDVGAHFGVYSFALLKLGHQVIAFEPDQSNQQRLRALLGDFARIERVALSRKEGSGIMRVPLAGQEYGGALASLSDHAVPEGAVATTYGVRLRTLDSYSLNDVSFIKIDVEGHEEAVLAGAADTLRRTRPVLLIEIEDRHNPGGLNRIAVSLSKLGYRGYFYWDRKRYDLSEFDLDLHQVASRIVGDQKNRRRLRYVNNFVFSVTG